MQIGSEFYCGLVSRAAFFGERLEQYGFEVTVVKDATAAAQHPELGDGYAAALINFGFIASEVIDTDAAVAAIS